MADRTCSDCPAPVSSQSKTGRCRKCALIALNADPAFQARRRERLAVTMNTPEVQARHKAGCARGAAQRLSDPVKLENMREIGRRYGAPNIVHTATPEARAKVAAATRAFYLQWCPEEHWPLNHKLKRQGFKLAERKEIILQMVPGTVEHARKSIANVQLAQRLRAERERAQAY